MSIGTLQTEADVARLAKAQLGSLGVDVSTLKSAAFAPGDMVLSAGPVRAGYLPCDGAAVSRTTYAHLFAAVGTIFGTGDGSTTFNVPNIAPPSSTRWLVRT